MKQTNHAAIRGSLTHRLRIVALLLLVACTSFPGALYAQSSDNASTPEVIVLSQTETPEGIQTTLQINVRKDSFLSSRHPDTNFGGSNVLRLGWSSGDFDALRILIEFDIAAIPSNAVINSARLFIYQSGAVPGGDRNMDYRAQFMRNSWDEGGVTWNNANYLGGDALPLGSVDSGLGWKSVDATNVVKTWYSGGRPNYGLIVTGDEIPSNDRMRVYSSREQGGGISPYIVVDYTTVCDNVAPNAFVNGLPAYSPGEYIVSWSGTDSAPSGCSPSGIASYDVDYRINGSSWHSWKNQTQSTSNTFKNWANNGDLVEFRGRATDNAGNVQPMGDPQTSTRIDTQPPSVTVNPLPATTAATFFTLSWSGIDNLSGVANYDVQWRENGGEWETLLEESNQTAYQITGAQNGVTYDFRVRATDQVGNGGEWPDDPQTSTMVNTSADATVLPFVPSILKPSAPITTSFKVNWVGTAANPGAIASYDIFYQFNNGPWVRWQTFPGGQTSGQFPLDTIGFGDGVYGFEAIAINSLGQREPQTFTAEATMIVDLADAIQPRAYLPVITDETNAVVAEGAEPPQE